MLAVAAVGWGDQAAAQTYGRTPQRAATARPEPVKRPEPIKRQDGLLAVVSIAKQKITVYGPNGVLAQSPVSTGVRGKDTPTGVFTILQKNKHHVSNIYEGASMPYMQRLTWSGIAMHAGYVPGFPASHGCVRMPMAFAERLWEMTKLGARVVVVPDAEQARETTHAQLPVPTLLPVVADLPQLVKTAARETDEKSDAAPSATEARLLNPIDRARETKDALAAEAVAKLRESKTRAATAVSKVREAAMATYAHRVAVRQAADWQVRRDRLEAYLTAQTQPQAIARVGEQWADAEKRLVQARDAEATARERDKTAVEDAKEAQRLATLSAKDSETARIAAKSAEKAAAGDPISVFVSRKTGRVQVRQGWHMLHDAPIVFKEPAVPLGTHVYVALEPVGRGDSLRWTSISFAGGDPVQQPSGRRAAAKPVPAAPRSTQTAETVLDLFEMAPESQKFISERLWTGATLIVSDQGPSVETGRDTDFVILTR